MRDLLMFTGSIMFGLGLIVFGLRERPPKCAHCQKRMKRLSGSVRQTTDYGFVCGNNDCNYYGYMI